MQVPSPLRAPNIRSSRRQEGGGALPLALALVASLSFGATGCTKNRADDGDRLTGGGGGKRGTICQPSCQPDSCGDDGCGGYCTCSGGTVCSAEHRCVPDTACSDTCEAAGWECGELCDVDCGQCGAGASCIWNRCYATVQTESCSNCPLKLVLVEQTETAVTLAVDYFPTGQEPHPRMADIHIHANKAAKVQTVQPGDALAEAGKRLFADPYDPSRRWRKLGARTWRVLVLSLSNTNVLTSGRVATVTFDLSDVDGPIGFKLLKRDQTFAPFAADSALQSSRYDGAVVIERPAP